ncbi:amidohydrolase family protein [Haloglycomyces albus]|uniref:amidohydrolase family protein n=1 Tax=Haloglycomyces albus TaxID=526067 RepID=UPI00046CE148|nr:amidohydrolase family protein [Haloglycomyces albus]
MHIYAAPMVLPIGRDPIADGAVAVDDDGYIAYVGPADDAPDGEVTRFDGMLTPGLVNAHTHLCYSSYTDMYESDKEFFEWIQQFAVRNPEMDENDWAESARAGVQESLRHGTTAVADIVTPAAAFPALLDSPLTGILYWEALFQDDTTWETNRSEWRDVLTETRATKHNDDIAIGVSPHALYTLSSSVASSLAELARTLELRLHPHLAESGHEDLYVRRGAGPFSFMMRRAGLTMDLSESRGADHSPAVEADKLNWLGDDCHVAHGVHLDAEDRRLLREANTSVALCIRSNQRLEAGVPPVAAYRAEGNSIAIGTDSRASSPDLDVAGELLPLRQAALSQGDSGEGLSEWLVRAATQGGARALGRDDIGELAEGKRADLAHFAIKPGDNPYRSFVEKSAGQCTATVTKGRLHKHD